MTLKRPFNLQASKSVFQGLEMAFANLLACLQTSIKGFYKASQAVLASSFSPFERPLNDLLKPCKRHLKCLLMPKAFSKAFKSPLKGI